MVVVECFTKFPRHEEESPWVFSRATARSPHVHGHSRAPTTFTVISRALQRALVCRCGPSAAFRMPEGLPPRRGLPPELTPKKQHVPVHLRSREANRTTCTSRYAHAAQAVPRAAAANARGLQRRHVIASTAETRRLASAEVFTAGGLRSKIAETTVEMNIVSPRVVPPRWASAVIMCLAKV